MYFSRTYITIMNFRAQTQKVNAILRGYDELAIDREPEAPRSSWRVT
jgi:hypothetical protein